MRYIFLQVLNMPEYQIHDLKDGQELDMKYLEEVQARVTQDTE